MGLDIIIPVVLVAVLVPAGFVWAKRTFKDEHLAAEVTIAPGDRLTSNVLRELGSPPWRVVYEVAPDKLGGISHVLIGSPGVFALETRMSPLPEPGGEAPDARAIGAAAVLRGGVDDALRNCAMSSDGLVRVHWGVNHRSTTAVDEMYGVTAVDGRTLTAWATALDPTRLTPAQVDLAWQTVVTALGRPDPLA